jgi:hypothetical protein
MIRITFDDSPFVRSHMTKPGRGLGSWAFSFEGREPIFSPPMILSEAKKWAREQVKAAAPADYAGQVVVSILP